jgi:hypothetical protein
MPPGRYTVRLTVDGATQTQPLEVRKDPNSAGTEAEIAEQVKALAAIKGQLNEAATAVHRVEAVRLQLRQVQRLAASDAEVAGRIKALDAKLTDAEMLLVDLRQTGTGQDGVRFGSRLISKMGYLANGVATADFRPTSQAAEVQVILGTDLKSAQQAIETVLRDLPALNQLLDGRGLPKVVDRSRIVP